MERFCECGALVLGGECVRCGEGYSRVSEDAEEVSGEDSLEKKDKLESLEDAVRLYNSEYSNCGRSKLRTKCYRLYTLLKGAGAIYLVPRRRGEDTLNAETRKKVEKVREDWEYMHGVFRRKK